MRFIFLIVLFGALVGCEEKGAATMHSYPILPLENFFQSFSALNARLTTSERKSIPGLDKYGYMPMNNGGKIGSQAWSKRDYGDPNINDLSISVAWHESEAESKNYYYKLAGRSVPNEPAASFEMPSCDEYSARILNTPGRGSLLLMVARYGNYVFNVVVLTKTDGYFPDVDAFRSNAKAFDTNIGNLLNAAKRASRTE